MSRDLKMSRRILGTCLEKTEWPWGLVMGSSARVRTALSLPGGVLKAGHSLSVETTKTERLRGPKFLRKSF